MRIKTKTILIGVLFILSILSVIYILTSLKKEPLDIDVYSSIENIVPGETTEENLLQNLGAPISSTGGTLQYKSNSPTRNNEVVVQNGSVDFVRQIVSVSDNINYLDLQKKYGDLSILYGPDSINGYFLYFQTDKGVAYIANSASNDVLEIWYFTPTTYKIFKETWASVYSEEFLPQY